MDFTCFFEGDHQTFEKMFFHWLGQAQKRLRTSWNIEDACLCLMLIEIQFNEGLVSEKETNMKQTMIFYRSRLKLVDLIHCFYGRILTATSRNELVKNFVIYDHLVQKLERTESVELEHVYEQFTRLLPHLDQYKSELCHLCTYFNRPYRLPQTYWNDFKKNKNYSPCHILLKWMDRRKYVSAKTTKSNVNYLKPVLAYHQLCQYRKSNIRRQRLKDHIVELPCQYDVYFDVIKQLKTELLNCCCEIKIIEKFIILDGLLSIGEEWFLVDQQVYQSVFTDIKEHLLEAFRFEEIVDFLRIFERPYIMFDG